MVVNKIKKIRQKYRTEKDKMRKSGNGKQKKWKFFDQVDQILANRHNVTPVAKLDTMKESENIDDGSEFPDNLEDSGNLKLLLNCAL